MGHEGRAQACAKDEIVAERVESLGILERGSLRRPLLHHLERIQLAQRSSLGSSTAPGGGFARAMSWFRAGGWQRDLAIAVVGGALIAAAGFFKRPSPPEKP